MGAVQAEALGPISAVTRIRYGAEQEGADAARIQEMRQTMEELRPVLDLPVYEGDVETALIHHMGEKAFGYEGRGSDEISHYKQLAKALGDHASTGMTPVLIEYNNEDEEDDYSSREETALILVDPAQPAFRSMVEQIQDAKPNQGFTTPVARTKRQLSLVGHTVIVGGRLAGLFGKRQTVDILGRRTQDGLVLSQTTEYDVRNRKNPPKQRNHEKARHDINMLSFTGISHTSRIGWANITAVLLNRMNTTHQNRSERDGATDAFQYVREVRDFFDRSGELKTLLKKNLPVRRVINAASALEESLDALAPEPDGDDWR